LQLNKEGEQLSLFDLVPLFVVVKPLEIARVDGMIIKNPIHEKA